MKTTFDGLDEVVKRIFHFDHSYNYSDDGSVWTKQNTIFKQNQELVKALNLNDKEYSYILEAIIAKWNYVWSYTNEKWNLIEPGNMAYLYKNSIMKMLGEKEVVNND